MTNTKRTQIEAGYGQFMRKGNTMGEYYVNYENSGWDPSYIHDTYFIVFDENNIAVDAYFRQTSKGG